MHDQTAPTHAARSVRSSPIVLISRSLERSRPDAEGANPLWIISRRGCCQPLHQGSPVCTRSLRIRVVTTVERAKNIRTGRNRHTPANGPQILPDRWTAVRSCIGRAWPWGRSPGCRRVRAEPLNCPPARGGWRGSLRCWRLRPTGRRSRTRRGLRCRRGRAPGRRPIRPAPPGHAP